MEISRATGGGGGGDGSPAPELGGGGGSPGAPGGGGIPGAPDGGGGASAAASPGEPAKKIFQICSFYLQRCSVNSTLTGGSTK